MRVSFLCGASWFALACVAGACTSGGGEAGGEPGRETGPCVEYECLGGELVCLSNLCVDPNAATGPSTEGTSDGVDTTSGGSLVIDCSQLGSAAVGATYMGTITATGGESPYEFAATALPDGLVLDMATGDIAGVPTTAGTSSLDVTVTDATGNSGTTSCPLEIGSQLALVPVDAVPYCLTGTDTLLDRITPGTGDGSAIVCDTPGGTGNGKLPAGVSIDPDTCAIVGATSETRLGTWAFIVRGTQSDAEVFMPYCVTQPTHAAGTFDIAVDHSGMTDATLVPLVRTFDPDATVVAGDGIMDPVFMISDPDSCGATDCGYGYNYFIDASPFDAMNGIDITSAVLLDAMDQPIGFSHTFQIEGPVVADEFKTRPWVVNVDWDYCIAPTQSECSAENVAINANGFLEFSVIMVPMPA